MDPCLLATLAPQKDRHLARLRRRPVRARRRPSGATMAPRLQKETQRLIARQTQGRQN